LILKCYFRKSRKLINYTAKNDFYEGWGMRTNLPLSILAQIAQLISPPLPQTVEPIEL
jgi:hypothetical protein